MPAGPSVPWRIFDPFANKNHKRREKLKLGAIQLMRPQGCDHHYPSHHSEAEPMENEIPAMIRLTRWATDLPKFVVIHTKQIQSVNRQLFSQWIIAHLSNRLPSHHLWCNNLDLKFKFSIFLELASLTWSLFLQHT